MAQQRLPRQLAAKKILKALKGHGVFDFESHRRGGSHWSLVRYDTTEGDISYPVPLPNGKKSEVKKVYLKQIIDYFDLPDGVFDSDKKRAQSEQQDDAPDDPIAGFVGIGKLRRPWK